MDVAVHGDVEFVVCGVVVERVYYGCVEVVEDYGWGVADVEFVWVGVDFF